MFKNKHKLELPSLGRGRSSDKELAVSIPPADDESSVLDSPFTIGRASSNEPHGSIRNLSTDASLVSDANDTNRSTANEKDDSPTAAAGKFTPKDELLGSIRNAAMKSSLVMGAKELRESAASEMAKAKGIVTKENSSNDEKLRSLLHLIISSGTESSLYNDYLGQSMDEDSDLLVSSFAGQVDEISVPLRMFDLDTMNMVDTSFFGDEDQYCMLSHSWKGAEIDYALVCEAQRAEEAPGGLTGYNDVDAVFTLCDEKIKSIAGKLSKSLQERPDAGTSVRDLLVTSLRVSMLERDVVDTKKKRTIEDANKRQADLEYTNYQKLLDFLKEVKNLPSLEKQREDAEKRARNAVDKYFRAEHDYASEKPRISKFRSNRQLSYEMDDLLRALQQRRSARKLYESVGRAREIFENRPFSKTGRRYIWLDNCCINKRQDAELSESLARMGEWYANADFCLVHLDTPWDNREWLDEWDLWCKSKASTEEVGPNNAEDNDVVSTTMKTQPRCQPVSRFNEVKEWKPTWATRGWTLQELVLSKMTFYANADWKMLSRPVDSLGFYYHFCPFIDFYTQNLSYVKDNAPKVVDDVLNQYQVKQALEAMAALEGREMSERKETSSVTPNEEEKTIGAENIIWVLRLFGYVAPKNLDKQTARARISYSVQVVVEAFKDTPSYTDPSHEARELILEMMSERYAGLTREKTVRRTINLLLGALAHKANEFIRIDRKIIAAFSNVEGLSSWWNGTERSRFSAQSVMMLASHRQCTKPIDKAYSLMGVLGVQFPAFPAEGLTKALSRLMDEVVITSNDVSVFNWTGKYNGSPIRGRSLYASNIDAFYTDSRFDVNGELVRIFRNDRTKTLNIAKGITDMLLNASNFVSTFNQAEETVSLLLDMVEFIRKSDIHTLERLLDCPELVKTMKGAGDYARRKRLEDAKRNQKLQKPDTPRTQEPQTPEAPGIRRKKSWGVNLSNLHKGNLLERNHAAKKEKATEGNADNPQKPEEFEAEIQSAVAKALNRGLMHEDNESSAKDDESSDESSKPEAQATRINGRDQQIICPNPIVVNSSGIKGVFDIQRIVVKMLQPEELRAKVKNAASDNEMIDGWCTISTGFTLTMVAFCCERRVLEKQLDVVDVIEQTILKEPATPTTHTHPHPQSNVTDTQPVNSENQQSKSSNDKDPARDTASAQETDNADRDSRPKLKNYGSSAEQRRVSRMIDFVTEANLHAIAGEWALARFSGAPGAHWFLCRLELGTGHEFYARRIATDRFNFTNAVPEKGLVEFWHKFMHRKKLVMCEMLDHYLDAQKAGTYATWLHDNLKESFPWGESSESSDEDDEDEPQRGKQAKGKQEVQDGTLTSTGKALKMIGWGIRFFYDKYYAGYLEERLDEMALAKVPVNLHAAIKDLHADKVLLPVMFHSGRDVHFF
ncbi:hypothetical protein ASPBRDRAFT_27038 [Aspergillus brasiliensis CBS 101740]|uniref:Heterokaryon incompatibility domain-containing protein n=1 Tax=Aspergillus brasiliensis (strain CBS 101740 / IMI 381727 / IBT 21946) TaxID=767769 RepID=A0A1L9UY37_ASPBC|nr:hypothetical protein ASPBRDRAFT_27038 [Aspergillus brasiliensis CBS 101740]